MNYILLFYFITNIFINKISTQDYCNIASCADGSQTKCQFDSTPADACGDQSLVEAGISSDQRDEIVNFHNNQRNLVASGKESRGNPGPQPAAKNMKTMVWDDEIASIAQTWADQCEFKHDQCRNVDRFYVGQNIVYTAATDQFQSNLTSLMLSWYEEVINFDRKQVNIFSSTPAGHYTQMVWANSEFLGCGLIKYVNNDGWFATYLVCNYGPGGNILGQPIYETS